MSVTGIVLAGTYQWQRSSFAFLSRALLPIAYRPLISYPIAWLHEAGIREVIVCAKEETAALETALAADASAGVRVTFVQDPMPRGTAGSVLDAAATSDSDTFVIVEGAAIPTVPLDDLLSYHRASGAQLTVVVHQDRRDAPAEGVQSPAGIYVMAREALAAVPTCGFCDIKETLIPTLYRAGAPVVAYRTREATARVQDWDSYHSVSGWAIQRMAIDGPVPEHYIRVGHALIHRSAEVADDAVIVGSAWIGPRARVEPGAILTGPCAVGPDALVDAGAAVSRSILWRDARVGEHAVADRVVVCDYGVVAAGSSAHASVIVPASHERAHLDAARTGTPLAAPADMWRRLSRALLPAARPAQEAR